jgi:hypothetical protein
MLLQSCNDLMRALGADVGIPDLALDEAHCCTLAFDWPVSFELDEGGEQLFLYASQARCRPPARGSEQLLEGNLLGRTRAERRSARPPRVPVMLHRACPSACPGRL